ncbi:MAG: diadenylate cyclase CdaA [Bacteroidales bacterium]|nr:diadenylate cyclase CdaA [Bacteroidales bacterium]
MVDLIIDAFIKVRFLDVLDIFLVGLLLYMVYTWIKGSSAINIFLTILGIVVILKVVQLLHMELLSAILGAFVDVGFIALIIIFQPEIRRFLLSIGNSKFAVGFRNLFSKFGLKYKSDESTDLDTICEACISMGEGKVGALILLTQENDLQDIVDTGVKIDAIISKPLLENIFFKNSPLHDGAMVIANNKIVSARCILPITQQTRLPGSYGLRHRAGIGVSEMHDCIVLVVSEETGSIRIVFDGKVYDVKPNEMKAKIKEIQSRKNLSK